MHIRAPAIICAVRAHGEHGAIVRAMTAEDGLLAGYVRGGRSRTMRPVLIPSNLVMAEFRARTEEQLAGLTVELIHSRGPMMAEPLAAAALDWTTALTASTLPEGQPYPQIHQALTGVLDAIEAAPSARGWARGLILFEGLMLARLGFGIPASAVPDSDALWPEIMAALADTGDQLDRHIFAERRVDVMAARERLIERLKRAVA
jgi:DNA repair protein RecO (recombination protein O)